MSLCGGLTTTSTPSEEAFLHHIITYDEFVTNPTLVSNPNLVIRVDGKMYNWRTASPVIMSLAAFQKPLPQVKSFEYKLNYYCPLRNQYSL